MELICQRINASKTRSVPCLHAAAEHVLVQHGACASLEDVLGARESAVDRASAAHLQAVHEELQLQPGTLASINSRSLRGSRHDCCRSLDTQRQQAAHSSASAHRIRCTARQLHRGQRLLAGRGGAGCQRFWVAVGAQRVGGRVP